MIEDPTRQLSYLQQCLSSDKKPLGLFLGAGCPMAIRIDVEGGGEAPLIPDIAGITEMVRAKLEEDTACKPLLEIVDEHFGKDERHSPTVEEMLTHIRALRAVAGNDMVRGLSADNLDKLDDSICKCIHEVADKVLPNDQTPYHRAASWVDAARRGNPVEIFTTNYDLLMEQAFEDCRVPYFDGFAGVRKPFFDLRAMEEDMLPPRWARLWKLHGSINWYQMAEKGVFRGTNEKDDRSRRVIHPSHLKYQESRRMPYLAMIDRLRAFLGQPSSSLILCGYSFRDEHINEVIVQGLQRSQTAIAFALLYERLSGYPQAAGLARKRPNLNLLARDGAIIGGQNVEWSPKDKESVSADDNRWLRWKPVDPKKPEGKLSPELALGDFAVFGQLLQEVVGTVPQGPAIPNAQ